MKYHKTRYTHEQAKSKQSEVNPIARLLFWIIIVFITGVACVIIF